MPHLIPTAFRLEVYENLRLAVPLIAAQLAAVGMGAIDTVFAGRLGAQSLAAVAVGVNFHVLFFVCAMGVLMVCSPIVAQLRGAGRSAQEIGGFMRRARRFAVLLALVWFAGVNLLAAPVLALLQLDAATTLLAIRFVRFLSASAFGFSLYFALRFCAEGAGQMRPIFVAGVAGLAANALLDWLLVFGHYGLPALGAIGCGVATSLSSALMAASLWLAYRYQPQLRIYRVLGVAPGVVPGAADSQEVRTILRLGLPVALILLGESGLFVLSAMLMAQFGDAAVAAYQVAINFASLLFMIPLGMAQATTVRVGLAAGAGDSPAVRFRGFAGMGLSLVTAASNAVVMVLFGGAVAATYSVDPVIVAQAAHFLLLAAAFQFFDGLQATANGALRGVKDTRMPLLATLVAYWLIGLPVAWVLAFRGGQGPDGLWWGLTSGLGVSAAGLSWRFAHKSRP